jgi:hypothetical protein
MPRFEAERLQNLDEVLCWYELQLSLLNEEDRRLPQLLSSALVPERYRDQSLADLREQFASARKHLRYAAMLHLLTTAEALLRLSFEDLSKRKSKPALFRRFRQLAGLWGTRARESGAGISGITDNEELLQRRSFGRVTPHAHPGVPVY